MHCFADHAPKYVKDRFTKVCRLIPRELREGTKTVLNLLFLPRRKVLRKD